MEKQDVLNDAQDITIVRNLGNGNFIYGARPSLETQRHLYELSISAPEDANIPEFKSGYWEFDEETGINGSSTYLALRFDKCSLRPFGLWLPELLEAKTLKSQGKLEKGVYRDYGIVVFNDKNPDEDVAKALVSQARIMGLQLPLIAPFRALDYSVNGKQINPFFVQSSQGIISGESARREIDLFDYKGDSGVCGLYLDRNLDLYSDGGGLDNAVDDGRVDWVCGETHRAELEGSFDALLEREYGKEMRRKRESFQRLLVQ